MCLKSYYLLHVGCVLYILVEEKKDYDKSYKKPSGVVLFYLQVRSIGFVQHL